MRHEKGPYGLRHIDQYDSAGGVEDVVTLQGHGTVRIHPSNANVFLVVARANLTIRLAAVSEARGMVSVTLLLQQDAVGSRTVTWGSEIDWGTTGAPTLTTTANKVDVVTFVSVNGGKSWYGFLSSKGFSAP